MSATKKLTYSALFLALCVVFPLAFHFIPNGGQILSPMHIPVLLCGMICGPVMGLTCGLLGPLMSSLITKMPPLSLAVLPAMMAECAVYGLVSGLLMKFVRTKSEYADMYISLVAAMLSGRIIGGITQALFHTSGGYSFATWVTGYFVTSLPGIAFQLALIPSLIYLLTRAHLVEIRYPAKNVQEAEQATASEATTVEENQ